MAEKLNSSDTVPPEQDVFAHTPTSYSRTSNTRLTQEDKASMDKLKTKMFTETAPNSDTVTKGNLEAAFEVESLSPAELLEQPVTGDGKVLISSEQLKHMSTLLDSPRVLYEVLGKLHQLQAYKVNASTLYEELKQGNTSDPQDAQNMVRMANLITDIKQHELSYLRMLQQLMLQATSMSDGEGGNRVAERPPDPKGENSENRTTEEDHQVDDEEESEEEDDQDELVHELAEEEHQRELVALREQKALLLKLIEQQRQLKALESKQASLTSLRNEAEARLSEIQQQEGQKLNNEVVEPPSTEEGSSQPSPKKQMNRDRQEEEEEEEGEDMEDELDEETKASLLQELMLLRERKQRLNNLLLELESHAMLDEQQRREVSREGKRQGGASSQGNLTRNSYTPNSRQPPERPVGHQHKVTWSAPPNRQQAQAQVQPQAQIRAQMQGSVSPTEPILSQPVTSNLVPSEIVDVLPPAVEKKLQSLNHAKGKLEDVHKMLSQAGLNDSSIVSSPEKYAWNNDTTDGDTGEPEDKEDANDTLEEELEARILQQKDELELLMEKKEELLQMREMLRQMHIKEGEGEVNGEEQAELLEGQLPPPPSSAQQHQLYDELVRKNKQLKLAQRKNNELDDHENSSVQYSWDVTAATWGGSTAHTMESEGMSMYSTEDFDTTKETASQQEEEVEHGAVHPQRYTGRRYTYEVQGHMPKGPGGEGVSAEDETTSRETYTVNSVPVSVERHTPRHFDGIQRPTVNTPPTDQQLTPRSAGKKRRLDHPDVEEWPQQYYEPGLVPFPQQHPTMPMREEASLNSSFNIWGGQVASNPVVSSEFQQLQRQLADSTNMCSELLRSQVQLIGMVSQRMGEGGSLYTPGVWSYSPYYNTPGVGYQQNRPSLSSLDQYMQQLQGYHRSLQTARDQLAAQQNVASGSTFPAFGSDSINLPPPPPSMQQPVGLFGSPVNTQNMGPPLFPTSTQAAKPFVSPKFNFSPSSTAQKPLHKEQTSMFHPGASGRQSGRGHKLADGHLSVSHQMTQPTASPLRVKSKAHSGHGAVAQNKVKSAETLSVPGKPKEKASKPVSRPQPDMYTTMAERSRQLAMEEFKAEAQGGTKVPPKSHSAHKLDETVDREEDSESSMPCSLPGDMEAGRSKRQTKEVQQGPQDETNSGHNYSLFDALRETIYSEVATLIANNESRPHFLIELFRELQLLTTDYLRQRALYGIQDLVTRFLTEESLETDGAGFNPMNYQSWLGSTSEPTASESVVTSEGLSEGEVPAALDSSKQTYDYSEGVESASSLSTPKGDENPFEQDNLGDTVIHFGDSLKHVRRLEESFNEADSTLVATPQTQETSIEVDSQQLDNEIKTVMMHVIPILKDNLHQACTAELLMTIQQPVVALVMATEKPQKEFVEILQRQLETSVAATLAKYQGKVLRDCGENLLVDLSEVLFNELGFFRVLQDMKVDPKTLVDASQEQPPRGTGHPTGAGVLTTTMTAALHEEEEALGKTRDDEMAVNCDFSKVHSMSVTTDEEQTPVAKVKPHMDPKLTEPSDPNQSATETVQETVTDVSSATLSAEHTETTLVQQGDRSSPAQQKDGTIVVQQEDSGALKSQEDAAPTLVQEGDGSPTLVQEEDGSTLALQGDVTVSPQQGKGTSVVQGETEKKNVTEEECTQEGHDQPQDGPLVDHSSVLLDLPEKGGQTSHSSFDTIETMSDLPSVETVSTQPTEQAGISVQQEQISVQLSEEQKTVSGVTGILHSLAEVPELVGSDTPVEPAVPEM